MGTLIHGLSPQYTAGSFTSFTMDATTDFIAFRRRVLTTSPIIKVECFIGTKTGTPGDMGVVLCTDVEFIPSVSGGVPVDIGGGSPTLLTVVAASVTNNSRHTFTFTNAYTPTAGEYVWVVFYPISGTWDASNRYIFRQHANGMGIDHGDENSATSTNTGTGWTPGNAGCPQCSLLTTGDAYLPCFNSVCLDNASTPAWDDADNPDERGTAWTVSPNTTSKVYGIQHLLRPTALTSDFEIRCYLGETEQDVRTINTSALVASAPITVPGTLSFNAPPLTLTAGTGRVTVKATHASDTIASCLFEFGSQARRESCFLFRDYWYCNRNGGAGAITDDLTRVYAIEPVVEHYGSGGGGTSGGFIISG